MGDQGGPGGDGDPFQVIAELTPLPIAVVRFADDALLWVNRTFARNIGRPAEELIGRRASEFLAVPTPLRDLVGDGGIANAEVEGRRADGTKVRLLLSANVIDYRGERAIVASAADITAHEETIDALRQSEERLRAIAELAPFPVGVTRLSDSTLVYVNDAFAQFMLTTPEQLLGRPAPDFYADAAARDAMLALLRERGSLYDYQIRARRPDGSERLVLVSLRTLVFDGDAAIMAAVADITDWHAAESALRDERLRLDRMLEIAGEAIVSVDADMNIILFNRGAEETFGYSAKEAIGRPLDILVPEASRAGHIRHIAAFADSDESARRMGARAAVSGRRKDGVEFPAGISISKLRFGGKMVFTAIVRDLTATRAAAEELEQSRTQLLHSQKMEAVGRLAGGVAHDFNNLLTAIYGSTAILTRRLPPDSALLAEVDEVQSAAERAAKLTQQLLAISRKQPMHRSVVDLNHVVSNLRGMLERLIGDHLKLETNLSSGPLLIEVDVGQLEQVILNLVINAADAIDGAGTITVTTGMRVLEEAMNTATGVIPAGPSVTLSVRDSGAGMAPATLARVFEPFYTTKHTGTGLGLSIVMGIVDQSGGAIEVTSTQEDGTTFCVSLPEYEGAERPVEIQPVESTPFGGAERILITEDDARVRRLATRELEDLGYDVLVASSAEDAIALCKELTRPPDLVLTDVVMPGLSGRDLADHIARVYPRTKILYMSGYSHDFLADKGFLEQGIQLLHKPFSPGELAAKVRGMLDHPAT